MFDLKNKMNFFLHNLVRNEEGEKKINMYSIT